MTNTHLPSIIAYMQLEPIARSIWPDPSCWISPEGAFYGVPTYHHRRFSLAINDHLTLGMVERHGSMVEALESRGWMHWSSAELKNTRSKFNNRQIDAVYNWIDHMETVEQSLAIEIRNQLFSYIESMESFL